MSEERRVLSRNNQTWSTNAVQDRPKKSILILIIANYQRGVYGSKADFLQAIVETNGAAFIDEMPEDNHYLVNEGINDSEYCMKIVDSQVVIVKMNKSVHMIRLNVKYNQIHVEKIQIHFVKIMQSYEKYRQHNNIYINI